jgi:hypothetical protein
MINKNRAVIFPYEKNSLEPISINWNGKSVFKAAQFFSNLCANAKKESPPRLFKQIIYFYEGDTCKYLKPFN